MGVIALLHDRQAISDLPGCRASRPAHIVEFEHEAAFTIQGRNSSCEVYLALLVPPLHLAADVDRSMIWLQRWRHHHPFRPKCRRDDDVPDSRWRAATSIFRFTMRGSSASC